jgi:hypothetical protein
MNQIKITGARLLFVLAAILLTAACAERNDASPTGVPQSDPAAGDLLRIGPSSSPVDEWLRQLQAGEIESYNEAAVDGASQSLRWALGYLTYYGAMENIGLDNLIYNALRAHIRLATGETTTISRRANDDNLLRLTDGIQYDPALAPENQVAQTPAIRQAILNRIVSQQDHLSPAEALASDEVIGVVAAPSPEDIGAKYLVYSQASPEAEFVFRGVIIVADAVTKAGPARETYSFQGWQQLPWLGDGAGPFWRQLPTGLSGEPDNTNEGRPGVLLLHEGEYRVLANR